MPPAIGLHVTVSLPPDTRGRTPTSRAQFLRGACILVLAVLLGAAGALLAYHPAAPERTAGVAAVRILFVGNSYTYVNDLPGTVSSLSAAGGHPVETATLAEGGWTLAQHEASPETGAMLRQHKWDYVVLQEQSEIPASPYSRTTVMYPAVRQLVSQVRAAGSQPILFLTWGHRDGWPQAGYQSFSTMQDQLTAGYLGIAQELQVPVSPAGEAWRRVRASAPTLDLWQEDGSHPTTAGTYLAACVFYSTIFRQSPLGLSYGDGLEAGTSRTLQSLAAGTVLSDPPIWYLR